MEDYPHTLAEMERRFSTEDACAEYLAAVRWPDGFVCPNCGGKDAWRTQRRLWHCRRCGRQSSVTAGTVFHRSRKPLVLWFRAMWHLVNQKYGANALGLQRTLDLGSYETAWQWLHKLRHAMVRPGRDRLSGCVQVDETYLGRRSRGGKRGRGAEGKEMIAIAIEDKGAKRIGRIRLRHVAGGKAVDLNTFVLSAIEPGSTVLTDDFRGYAQLPALGYIRQIVRPDELRLPHLAASLLKRWLLGTYQGAVRPSHLAYYLDEFTFRFNRRTSKSRGKLFYRLVQQALHVDPLPEAALKVSATAPSDDDLDVLESDHNI
jgi:transposase-like protein/predicted RNA-binding Zn-ribbon protein involved in translation (DUF1610 family)